MKKIYVVLLICVLFFIPTRAKALYVGNLREKLDSIPCTMKDDECYIDMPTIDPEIMLSDNRCVFTKESLMARDPEYYESYTDEQFDEEIANSSMYCKYDFYTMLMGFYFRMANTNLEFWDFNFNFIDKNNVVVSVYDVETRASLSKNFILRYKDVKKPTTVDTIKDDIKDEYEIFGLSVINTVFHYGNTNEDVYDNALVIYRFPELKNTISKYVDYDIVPMLYGMGGSPYSTGKQGYLGIIKDDILYDMDNVFFSMNHILYIDKDAEGTVYERAEKRISEYLKNKVDVSIDTTNVDVITDDENIDEEVNKYIGKTSGTYVGHYTTANIGGQLQPILIVEIPKEYLDVVNVKSQDYLTGININTSSLDVSLDTVISTQDVKDAEYVIKASKDNNLKIISVYDINLKKKEDNSLIKEVSGGVEVYIPVKGYKVNDKIDVYYIKTDSTIGQTIEATVVSLNDKLYAKFVTDHFSTYALVEKEVVNPQTGDNIVNTIILLGISIISLTTIIIRKKSYFFN